MNAVSRRSYDYIQIYCIISIMNNYFEIRFNYQNNGLSSKIATISSKLRYPGKNAFLV